MLISHNRRSAPPYGQSGSGRTWIGCYRLGQVSKESLFDQCLKDTWSVNVRNVVTFYHGFSLSELMTKATQLW